jgi:hypothetical protein
MAKIADWWTWRIAACGVILVISGSLFVDPVQAADTEGFFVEILLNTNHLGRTDEREPGDSPEDVFIGENAPGGTFVFAYGFTPAFALRAAISGAQHESTEPDVDFQYGSVTIEASYIFRAESDVRPYVYGGLGIFDLESDNGSGNVGLLPASYDYGTHGPGMDFGGGLYSFIGNHFVFDAGLRFDLISWENETARWTVVDGSTVIVNDPVEESGAAAKLLLGAGWWF